MRHYEPRYGEALCRSSEGDLNSRTARSARRPRLGREADRSDESRRACRAEAHASAI